MKLVSGDIGGTNTLLLKKWGVTLVFQFEEEYDEA
jgi:hypothetical protein